MTHRLRFDIVDGMIRLPDEEFEALVGEALEALPAEFKPYLRDVVIEVADLPDRRTASDLGLGGRRSLLGLYHGVPLTNRSVQHSGRLPDRITIYKNNIEACCRSRQEVVERVRATVLHEVGHHFGLDEDDLESKGY